MTTELIAATAEMVRERLKDDSAGHDWWHTWRVWRLARHIAAVEGADTTIVELAALLHDIEDWKFSGDEAASGRAAQSWLQAHGADTATLEHIEEIINTLSFKAVDQPKMRTREGMVVQDADRLDALGAIGVARAFAYGGWRGGPMHDPDLPPRLGMSGEEYRAHQGTTVNHFYEKLLRLRDLMNTPTAHALAAERHAYLEAFLARFLSEWGES